MPHYHRYGKRWGFAFLKIIIPHLLGKYWRYELPHTSTNLPVAKPRVSEVRRGSAWSYIHTWVCFLQVGFILSCSIKEILRVALALGLVHKFLMVQISTISGKFSDQSPPLTPTIPHPQPIPVVVGHYIDRCIMFYTSPWSCTKAKTCVLQIVTYMAVEKGMGLKGEQR